MGETLDKGIAGECPKHKIAYTGVCIQNDCFEKGLICPKCSPQSCIEKLGHKKMAVNDFYRLYINNIVNLVDFKSLNELINIGLEVQEKQLELQSQAFEEWELKMINDKFTNFKERMNKKIQNYINTLEEKLQNIYDDFINSHQSLQTTIIEIPEFKISNTVDYINENKNNTLELEKFMNTVKKVMDKDKLNKFHKDLKNIIYGKYVFDHMKTSEYNNLDNLNIFKNDIDEYVKKLINCIFPEQQVYKIYTNPNIAEFLINPLELKYKETITKKSAKNFAIDSLFDAFIAFDGNCYLASSCNSPFAIEIYNLSSNALTATFNILKQILIIRHFPQVSTKTDYLLTTTIEKSVKIYNINTFKEYLTINNCYKENNIYSALILFDEVNNKNYVVTSSPKDFIKFWSFDKGKFVKNVGNKDDYTYFINSWNKNDNDYIISANDGSVKIYSTQKENQLFGEYTTQEKCWHMSAFIEKINNVDTMFESDGKGNLRLWNLENHNMIKCINCQGVSFRGICLWSEKYILVASSDKTIKILDLDKGEEIDSIAGQHDNFVCTVKKIMHPKYGEALLSGSIDGTIKLWINKNSIDLCYE